MILPLLILSKQRIYHSEKDFGFFLENQGPFQLFTFEFASNFFAKKNNFFRIKRNAMEKYILFESTQVLFVTNDVNAHQIKNCFSNDFFKVGNSVLM